MYNIRRLNIELVISLALALSLPTITGSMADSGTLQSNRRVIEVSPGGGVAVKSVTTIRHPDGRVEKVYPDGKHEFFGPDGRPSPVNITCSSGGFAGGGIGLLSHCVRWGTNSYYTK